jgi:hypothetical protein
MLGGQWVHKDDTVLHIGDVEEFGGLVDWVGIVVSEEIA